MSDIPIVNISSDSEGTDSEIRYYSDSEFEDPGWTDYFPPHVQWMGHQEASSTMSAANSTITDAGSTSIKKPKKKVGSGSTLAKELPQALTQALETAIQNMKWPEPRKERPPKQVLGLACPRKQTSFDDKRRTAQKGKHSYEGKGKRPME